MNKWLYALAPVGALALAFAFSAANAQGGGYPLADKLADKVLAHYQSASCEQLMAKKAQPQSPDEGQMKQRVVQAMHNDPGLRAHFLNRVAAPIANKLFECGMIP
jgi:hypothetical protein